MPEVPQLDSTRLTPDRLMAALLRHGLVELTPPLVPEDLARFGAFLDAVLERRFDFFATAEELDEVPGSLHRLTLAEARQRSPVAWYGVRLRYAIRAVLPTPAWLATPEPARRHRRRRHWRRRWDWERRLRLRLALRRRRRERGGD